MGKYFESLGLAENMSDVELECEYYVRSFETMKAECEAGLTDPVFYVQSLQDESRRNPWLSKEARRLLEKQLKEFSEKIPHYEHRVRQAYAEWKANELKGYDDAWAENRAMWDEAWEPLKILRARRGKERTF